MKKLYHILTVLLFLPFIAMAQLQVNTNLGDNALIQTLGGQGVTISNVNIVGAGGSYGQFSNGGSMGISQGVILTSGSIQNAVGPNSIRNASTDNGAAGSAILDGLNLGTTMDATVVDFDIVPDGCTISFDYVFASEEYHRWVNSQFNDVFGFFISGPGITGTQNIALVNGTGTPVAINSINNGQTTACASNGNGATNPQLFVDNCGDQNIEYDGHTVMLQARADGLTQGGTYHITLAIADVVDAIWDSGVFISAGSFSSVAQVDFHFEHENQVEDDEFNLCEDVYLDGSLTQTFGNYYMDIWRIPQGGGSPQWLSAQGSPPSDGWLPGAPTFINITSLFANDPENPVNFQVGQTYEVKLAINDPNCGWVSETRRFTITEAEMSSQFEIVDYICHDGVYDVVVSAQDTGPSQWWGLYESSVEGATGDGTTIFPILETQTGITTATFTNLDPAKFYYIKHGVWTTNCPWQETRKALEPDCCDEFDDADFSLGVDLDYNFWVGNYNSYDDLDAVHEWYVVSSPNQGTGPYTPEFSTTTTGGATFPLFTGGQFGVYYTVVHKVVSYCGEICYAQEQFQEEGKKAEEYTNVLAVEIDCCFIFDFWPNGPGEPEEFTAEFQIGLDLNGNILTQVANDYANNPSAVHEWYLLSSPNASGGPYDLVDYGTGVDYTYGPIDDEIYYFLIHRVTTDCGEVCYGQSICRNCELQLSACELCGPIDCSILDDILPPCDDLVAPTNLQVQGDTLTWDAVPGALEYIVSSPSGTDPQIFCNCHGQISIVPLETDTNSVVLPEGLQSQCFVWMVTAVCWDGTTSDPSNQECYLPIKKGEKENTFENAEIAPNPSNGNMTFIVETTYDTEVTIDVYDFYGKQIQTFVEQLTAHSEGTINWNATGKLARGIYIVSFKTNEETIYKKIIVD